MPFDANVVECSCTSIPSQKEDIFLIFFFNIFFTRIVPIQNAKVNCSYDQHMILEMHIKSFIAVTYGDTSRREADERRDIEVFRKISTRWAGVARYIIILLEPVLSRHMHSWRCSIANVIYLIRYPSLMVISITF